jgi:hypothetical protein
LFQRDKITVCDKCKSKRQKCVDALHSIVIVMSIIRVIVSRSSKFLPLDFVLEL